MVFFRGVTWLRDSHGLFDYESRNITKKNIRTGVTGKIVRVDDEVEFFTNDKEIPTHSQKGGLAAEVSTDNGVSQILTIQKDSKSNYSLDF